MIKKNSNFGTERFKTDDEFKQFYLEKGCYIVAFKIFSVGSIDTYLKANITHSARNSKMQPKKSVSIVNILKLN